LRAGERGKGRGTVQRVHDFQGVSAVANWAREEEVWGGREGEEVWGGGGGGGILRFNRFRGN
jgi:hypothetical protein